MNNSPKMPKYAANMQNMRWFVSAYKICADNFKVGVSMNWKCVFCTFQLMYIPGNAIHIFEDPTIIVSK